VSFGFISAATEGAALPRASNPNMAATDDNGEGIAWLI